MAVAKLQILNSADKVKHYAVCTGEGVPAVTDTLVTDVKKFPVGSQYMDITGKKLYFRVDTKKAVADWTTSTTV